MAHKKIRPELLGSVIQTKKLASQLILEQTEECVQICSALNLDVFEASKPESKNEKRAQGDVSVS